MNRIAFLCFLPLFVVRPAVCAPQTTLVPQTPVPAPSPSPVAPLPDKQPPETPDYSNALWEPASPRNFQSANRPSPERPINIIVMHDIEGAAMSAVRWFQNPASQVSSHYVVDSVTGTVYQQVKERDVAWHAGNRNINGRSVGIEQGGFAYRPGFFTPALYEASANLVRDVSTRHNIPRDRAHIIGHFEVPDASDPTKFGGRGGHTDPGPYFDWDYFMTLVRNDAACLQMVNGAFRVDSGAEPSYHRYLVRSYHPGETVNFFVPIQNTGDDPWFSDRKDAQEIERRKAGTVYLGTADGTASPLFGADWVSPLYVGSAKEGDIAPGGKAMFTVSVHVPTNRLGNITQDFRLVSVSPAPHRPVPFGDTMSLFLSVVPWDITAPVSSAAPAGWSAKPAMGGSSLLWTKASPQNAPLRWNTTLPVGGDYDVYVRFTPGNNRTAGAGYLVGGKTLFLSQRSGTAREWRKLGRFAFNEPVPVTPPVTGAKATFDAVAKAAQPKAGAVRATVELSGSSPKPGIIAAGAVRFVGPFPTP